MAVYDLRGRRVLAARTPASTAAINLSVSGLSKRLYLVRYVDAEQTLTAKFTKE